MTGLLCWRIEVAFAATPAQLLGGLLDTVTWTDITPAVRMADGVEATRGRTSDQGDVAAGSLRFTLNNDTGAFTPGRTDLLSDWVAATFDTVEEWVAAYPEYLLAPERFTLHGKPVRLIYDPGTPVTLWTGIVESVESGWTGGIRGVARVRAIDAAALVAKTTLEALPVAQLMASRPYRRWVYPLHESAAPCVDLVGADSYGRAAAPLTARAIGWPGTVDAEVAFAGSSPGSIPGEAESTVATFAGADASNGWCLDTRPRPAADMPDLTPGPAGVTVSGWIAPGSPGRARTALAVAGAAGTTSVTIRVTTTNVPQAVLRDGAVTLTLTAGGPILANEWAHVAVVLNDGTGTSIDAVLLVDGVSAATGNLAAALTGLGRRQITVGAGCDLTEPWDGQIANVAAHAIALSGAVLDWIVESGDGEATTERAARLLYAGGALSVFDVAPTAGASTMSPQHTRGQTVAAALDVAAKAESASWWALPDGPIRMGSRATYWGAAAAVTLPAVAVDAATGFTLDTSEVVNRVTVARPGGATITRRNTSSADTLRDRGPGSPAALHVASDAQAEAYADDVVARYGWPVPRTSTLAVDAALTAATVDVDALLAVDIDQVVEVTGLPAEAPDTQLRFVCLGITDRAGPTGWVRTFNVGRSVMLTDVWILGTSELDDTTVLAL